MPEIFRTRDLVIFKKGDAHAVAVSNAAASSGWVGGQGVRWFDAGRDELTVTLSDGLSHGFMLWGSDESSDQFTSMSRNQPSYHFGVIGFGGWIISVKNFEKSTYASRQAPPEVPLVYQAEDKLLFSLRGFWTKEDEWTASGDPRAPNDNFVGVVVQPPSALTSGYMTIQVMI